MRRPVLIAAVVVVVIAAGLALLSSVKRVAEDQYGLRIHRDGRTTAYAPGMHFVPPFSGRFIRFPLGPRELRFPRQGSWQVPA